MAPPLVVCSVGSAFFMSQLNLPRALFGAATAPSTLRAPAGEPLAVERVRWAAAAMAALLGAASWMVTTFVSATWSPNAM